MKFILTEKQQNIIAKSLLNEITSDEIMAETENVDLTPTDAQKEAGNYRMGHISVKGMRISIENPIGSKRYFTKENGERGFVVMNNHYGYFNVSKGKDGDAVDVFIGPNIENFERVYCIDQSKKDGTFDETKVMLGFDSKQEAKDAYLSNYNSGWTGFMAITSVPLITFKKWLYRGRKQRQPFKDYVEIRKKQLQESKMLEEGLNNRYYKEVVISYFPEIKLSFTYHSIKRQFQRVISEKMVEDDVSYVLNDIRKDFKNGAILKNKYGEYTVQVINKDSCLVIPLIIEPVKKYNNRIYRLIVKTCYIWDGRVDIKDDAYHKCYFIGEESVDFVKAEEWNTENREAVVDLEKYNHDSKRETRRNFIDWQHRQMDKMYNNRYHDQYFNDIDKDPAAAHDKRLERLNAAYYDKQKQQKQEWQAVRDAVGEEGMDSIRQYHRDFNNKQLSSKGSPNRTLRAMDLVKQRKQNQQQ